MTLPYPDADAGPTAEREPVGAARDGLVVGFVPGVMPGKWFGRWDERFGSSVPLTRVAVDTDAGLRSLREGHLHMALVRPEREPEATDRDRYHAVELYRERRVAVLPVDHVLTLLDEVSIEDLSQEFLLQDPSEVPEWAEASRAFREASPRTLPPMRDLGDAVELVAAGLGLLVVPMSLARLHHRKDLTYRPVADVAETSVTLVWPRVVPGTRPEEDEAVLQEFVGITRGRRANSSRGDVPSSDTTSGASRDGGRRETSGRSASARASKSDGPRGGRQKPRAGKSSPRGKAPKSTKPSPKSPRRKPSR